MKAVRFLPYPLPLVFACMLLASAKLEAQLSFASAIDLALRNSPRVKMAEADAAKATAVLSESRVVFIPVLNAGSGLGYSYGFPVGQPTLYNFNLQSLAFDLAQKKYIDAARMGLEAANLALADARQVVAEDAARTCVVLDHDLQRLEALKQEQGFAAHLVEIVRLRMDAGQDNRMELTKSRLALAQITLATLHEDADIAFQRTHLANLTGLPADGLSIVSGSIPSPPAPKARSDGEYVPAIQAAYVNARSKFQVAFGDARKLYRPRVGFNFQYDRYATFNNYQDYYKPGSFRTDNFTVGTVVDLPVFQLQLRAKAKESLADALHAQSDADRVKLDFLEGRVKTINSLAELSARSEVAALEREIAGQQLEALRIQLSEGSGNGGVPPSPKDEQNALIQERQKYLDLLDADRQLREAQISALRLTGQLEEWLKQVDR